MAYYLGIEIPQRYLIQLGRNTQGIKLDSQKQCPILLNIKPYR